MSKTAVYLISIYFLALLLILLMYTTSYAATPNINTLIIQDVHKRINSKPLKEIYEPKREVIKVNSGILKTI